MDQSRLQPVHQTNLVEAVASQIVNLIQSGHLKAGDRLPAERKLATQLGIGRSALREAVRALGMLGILDVQHGGGIYVSALTPEALFGPLHLYIGLNDANLGVVNEAREVIEGAIMAHVAPDFPDDLLSRLRVLVADMEQYFHACEEGELDSNRVEQDVREFRSIIGQSLRNPVLLRTLEGLDALSAAARAKFEGRSGSWASLAQSHRDILQALENRDAGAARNAVEAHVRAVDAMYREQAGNF